jgi:hypothetical protein
MTHANSFYGAYHCFIGSSEISLVTQVASHVSLSKANAITNSATFSRKPFSVTA